jgi:hypothetical protein
MPSEIERNIETIAQIMSELPIELLHVRAIWLLQGANQHSLLTIEHDPNERAATRKGVDNTSE